MCQIYFSSLGIRTSPSLEVLLRHLRIIVLASPLDRWNCTQFPLQQTFAAIFTALQDRWKDLAATVKEGLRDTALIPVGHVLFKPTRLFFRLADDLSPFMHEVPRCFGPHESFLKHLGVRESPTRTDYVKFLQELRAEAGDAQLNPNELRAVVSIVNYFATPSFGAADTGAEVQGLQVFVPDDQSVLRLSSDCVVGDDLWLRDQAETQVRRMGLHFLHHCLAKPAVSGSTGPPAESAASALGIPRLSDVVLESLATSVEELLEASLDDNPDNRNMQVQRERLTNKLRCPAFLAGVAALAAKPFEETGGTVDRSAVHSHLSRTDIRLAASLSYRLLIRDPRRGLRPTPQNDSLGAPPSELQCEHPCLSFVHRASDASTVIFVNTAMLRSPFSMSLAAARGLVSVLSLPVGLAPSLVLLLDVEPAFSADILDTLRVGGLGASFATAAQRGVPGQPLQDLDADLLELKPFRSFRLGEIVAVFGDSPQAVYGVVVGVSDEPQQLSQHDVGLHHISVSLGNNCTKTMLSSEIYTFRAAKDTSVAAASPGVLVSAGASSVRTAAARLQSERVSESPASLPSQGSQALIAPGREDVREALRSLMTRSGIPFAADTEVSEVFHFHCFISCDVSAAELTN